MAQLVVLVDRWKIFNDCCEFTIAFAVRKIDVPIFIHRTQCLMLWRDPRARGPFLGKFTGKKHVKLGVIIFIYVSYGPNTSNLAGKKLPGFRENPGELVSIFCLFARNFRFNDDDDFDGAGW